MDSVTQSKKKLNLNDEYYSGESLSYESQFLEETKELVEKTFDPPSCSFYYEKRMMTFSVWLSITPTAEIARKILTNVHEILDVHFQKRRHFMKLAGALAI